MSWRKSGPERSDCNWRSCDAWLLLIAAAQNLPQISGSFRGLLLDDFRMLGLGGCFHHLSQQRRGERAVRIIMGFSQHDLWHRLWPVCAEITAHTLRQWRLGHRRLCSGQWVSGGCGCGGWRLEARKRSWLFHATSWQSSAVYPAAPEELRNTLFQLHCGHVERSPGSHALQQARQLSVWS